MDTVNIIKTIHNAEAPNKIGQDVIAFDNDLCATIVITKGTFAGKQDGKCLVQIGDDPEHTYPYDYVFVPCYGYDERPNDLLKERGSTHGDFDSSAGWKDCVLMHASKTPSWNGMSPAHRQAFRMIIEKLGRILYGNHDFDDHWCDVAGYAKLAEKSCGGKHEA